MNRNQTILLILALLSFPLIYLFIPDSQPGTISSLEGVTLSNFSGQKFRLAGQFTEKPILLVFWSVTCGTCIDEIPFLIRMHEELNEKLTVIGIHPPGYPQRQIKRFIRRFPHQIPYLLAIDDQSELIRTHNVTVLPRTILVDRQGKVLYDHLGYDPEKEKEIENAIKAKL